MKERITKYKELIDKSIHWINNSLEGNKKKEAYRTIVNCRRKLNDVQFAIEDNPAAAIYGESQVGKSYLISSLLSEEGKQFSIVDENNVVHNFIEEINPPGGGSESTSLVSRFSVTYKPKNSDFPVKAVLLRPAEIVLVLCDSFYNNIDFKRSQDVPRLAPEEINTEVSKFKERLKNTNGQQVMISEDDVLNMKDYFLSYFQNADKIIDSDFFEEVSLFISRVDPKDWPDIFGLLWNRNEVFQGLYTKLLEEYQRIDFSKEVYLPVNSVLYTNGTLLDVKRLNEIISEPDKIEPNYSPTTKLILPKEDKVLEFEKSYLCALTSELVFSQSDDLLKTKSFLNRIDLLDFPGVRARMEKPLDAVEKKIIPDLLLRGKVAYLFNRYSDAKRINILIFCAKHEQTAQRIMPRLLNNWVNKLIGDTAEKRESFVSTCKISPLFIISTFFNVNLSFNPIQDKLDGSGTPLTNRWLQRFTTTLEKEYIEKMTYSWFENWTKSQPYFQNIYLLRDFEKSETPSGIYQGFNTNKVEVAEVPTPQYPGFRHDLRDSFLGYDFVKMHFTNAEESWDEAASINKDGTKLIIRNLAVAAENIPKAHLQKIHLELDSISRSIIDELNKHFHSSDKDEKLQKAKNVAGDIQFNLDKAFAADKIKDFGILMSEFMISEGAVMEIFRKKVDSLDHRDVENNDIYSNYRLVVPVELDDTAEKYFERLCKHYEKTTEERIQAFRLELEENNIDLEELIKGNSEMIKNNAQQLADVLLEFWFEYIDLDDKLVIQNIFGGNNSLDDIRDMFKKLFKKVGLAKRIAEKIRRYVDGHSKTDLPYEIVADISAELLNKCINSVGYEYFDQSEINDLRVANDKNNLGLIIGNDFISAEGTIEEVFKNIKMREENMSTQPNLIKGLPSYRNYIAWSNLLKVGFISVCDIPSYNVVANKNLGKIIDEYQAIEF
ncbi:MAG: virulence factor SrfC family protein [Chitinophagales bacterium]